ncbi:MAG: NAD(P)-dependent oxidoreductase [Actinomycetota bacterium]|nr:NAD(P)-dependent oxidoreductase [Actinomycetota bacterium]
MSTVAVLGTGIMGAPMARNLAAAGHDVLVWNRTRERAEGIAGTTVAERPGDAVAGADVAITMVSDADAATAVMASALTGDVEGLAWAQMSTLGLDGTERCAALADERGIAFVDAPVLGTRQPAEEGKLVVLASGPDGCRARCQPVFDAVGQRTLWLGEAGAGTRLKLVANTWVLSLVEGLAETIALAEGLDVDPRHFLEAIGDGPLDLPYAQVKGTAMIERSFPPSFRLAGARKDAQLIVQAAERHGLDLPLPAVIAQRLAAGVAAGHGDEDLAATFRTSAIGAHTA